MSFQRNLGVGLGLLLGSTVSAQVTWTGSSDGAFSTPANWSASVPNDGTAALGFSASGAPQATVDAAYSIASITFQSGAPAYAITNANSAVLSVGTAITQASANTQTIAAPLSLGSSFTFAGASGSNTLVLTGALAGPSGFSVTNGLDLRLSGTWDVIGAVSVQSGSTLEFTPTGLAFSNSITNNGTLVLGNSSSVITHGGQVSGSGDLVVEGAVTLTGNNSYSGNTSVKTGALRIGATDALPNTTAVSVTGGLLELAANQTLRSLTVDYASRGVVLGDNTLLTIAPTTGTSGGTIDGTITGNGSLMFAGTTNSSLTLNAENSYTGGTVVTGGTVYVGGDSSLGYGSVTLQSGAKLLASTDGSSDLELGNDLVLGSNVTIGSQDQTRNIYLSGNVSLTGSSTRLNVGSLVGIDGALKGTNGATELEIGSTSSAYGRLLLWGTIDPSITTISLNSAGLIFSASSSVPTAGTVLIKGSKAYVGLVASPSANLSVSAVLALIDKGNLTNGVLGFDTLGDRSAPENYTGDIDLTGFGSVLTLGSSSRAILSGTITPAGSDYLFGNGGGTLVVKSALTGTGNVMVNSGSSIADNALTAIFQGNNSYSGSLDVTRSIAVLDSASALPNGSQINLGEYGYAGYTERFTPVAHFSDFARRVSSYTASSVLGLDSASYVSRFVPNGTGSGMRPVSDVIDLRAFSSIYLGTATNATLSGWVFAPNQGGAGRTLSLLAGPDANLAVTSQLLDRNVSRVVIGSSSSPYASGSVSLSGNNTYAGGTTLQSGTLRIAGASSDGNVTTSTALGAGTLTVAANAVSAKLVADSAVSLANAVVLGTTLQVGDLTTTSDVPTNSAKISAMTRSYAMILSGAISDLSPATPGGLDIYAPTELLGANTFSGGVTLHGTELGLGSDTALGTGTLTLLREQSSYDDFYESRGMSLYSSSDRTIANAIVTSASNASMPTLSLQGNFTFTGAFTLNSDLAIAPMTGASYVTGSISGGGRLYNDGRSSLVLSGANSYTGGTESVEGSIIFANAASMPATPYANAFSTSYSGYIGISFIPTNLQSSFIDRFNRDSTGTIGFDTDRAAGSANVFSGLIDLTGFASSVSLGTSTRAVLTGVITPSSSQYYFGGGGGTLEVRSSLVDGDAARSVYASSSSSSPITVRLTNSTNTYTGGTSAMYSAIVFGAGAIPAVGDLSLGSGGYIGTEDPAFATAPNSFLAKFAAGTSQGVIGFDGLNVTGDISLECFNSVSSALFLGTAGTASLSGTITLATNDPNYRFAGYKGGKLTVNSVLAGTNGVIAGDVSSPATDGSLAGSVTLTAANTYTGGTTLVSGALYIADDSALGTGVVHTGPYYITGASAPALFAAGGARTLANDFDVSSNGLSLGGTDNLTLLGNISGEGSLAKVGSDLLTLSGNNSQFSGSLILTAGSTLLNGVNPVGGSIALSGSSGVSLTFASDASLSSLSSELSSDLITLAPAHSLEITGSSDMTIAGSIVGGTAGLMFTGSGANIRLSGNNTFTGTTSINEGVTVIAASSSAFDNDASAVNVTGGTVRLESGVVVANPLTLNSGTLAGTGTFRGSAGTNGFNVGSNVTVSPGGAEPGLLSFDQGATTGNVLTLASGGMYVWRLADAAVTGGWDQILVNGNVAVTSSATAPFNFKISTMGGDGSSGLAANFDTSTAYSWTIMTVGNGYTLSGFTSSSQFDIDASGFMNSTYGVFGISQAGNSLVLNFTPVPEPSTYVLMALGLGMAGFLIRRRRPR